MEIKDSTFIVTGGSSGLGAACARRLVSGGGRVIIADVQGEAGQVLAGELGAGARFVHTDVTSEASVQAAVEAAGDSFGGLQGAINCAGIGVAMKVLSNRGIHDLEAFARVIAVNLTGTFNVIRLAAEAMSKGEPNAAGERGVIVNTASVAAYEGQIGQAAYSASKGGVVGLTLPIARELARYGIRVNTIVPGVFITPMTEKARQNPEVMGRWQKEIPMERLGHPEEASQVALFLCSEDSSYMTGSTITVDGGKVMR